MNTIKHHLELGSHSCCWHLGVLLNFGCIQEVKYKRSTLYAHRALDPCEVYYHFFLRKELIAGILAELDGNGILTLARLKDLLEESKQRVYYNLKILVDLEVLEKLECLSEQDPQPAYRINPRYESVYQKVKRQRQEQEHGPG